jgi:hypothetical protein
LQHTFDLTVAVAKTMATSNIGGYYSKGKTNKYYTVKKGGTVIILDLENNPEFSMPCQIVLIANRI